MTRTNLGRVPNQPKTPQKSFRCPADLWGAAKVKAARRSDTMSAVLVAIVEAYDAVDDGVWSRVKQKAAERGESLGGALATALRIYAAADDN